MTQPNEELLWKGHPSQVVNFWWYVACLLIVPIFIALWKWWEVRCRVYELTTERLKSSQGVFSKRTDQLEWYRVRDTTVVEPFLYRLFGKGNIVLNTTDPSTPLVTLEAVPDPNGLRDKLREAIEACRDRKRARLTELSGTTDVELDGNP